MTPCERCGSRSDVTRPHWIRAAWGATVKMFCTRCQMKATVNPADVKATRIEVLTRAEAYDIAVAF